MEVFILFNSIEETWKHDNATQSHKDLSLWIEFLSISLENLTSTLTELFIHLCEFVLPYKSCPPHMTGGSASHSTDTAGGASLGDGVINVSALTTCSAQLCPLFINHIPDSSVQNIHWCQTLLSCEGGWGVWRKGADLRAPLLTFPSQGLYMQRHH